MKTLLKFKKKEIVPMRKMCTVTMNQICLSNDRVKTDSFWTSLIYSYNQK